MRRRGCGADLCPVTAQVCVTSMPGISEVPHRSTAVSSLAGLAWQVPAARLPLVVRSCRRASTGPSADWAGTTAVAGRCFSDMSCRSQGWQGDNGSIGCGWTQLDVMGHDPKRASPLTRHTAKLRTPHGQNAVFTRRGMENPQVSGHSDGQGWAPCKTVGLAYVGSNPTPATTCGNGPWPGFSRRRRLMRLA
jgi:hypothetical protein